MIHQPKPLQELDLNNIPVDERINKLIETDDIEALRGIFDSIIKPPHIHLVSKYILKLIDLLSKEFEVIIILNKLTQWINKVDSIDPFIALYLKYIELSRNDAPYKQTRDIIKLLIKWVDKLPDSFPLENLFTAIIDNDLSYFSDEFPSFIDNLIEKFENIKLTKSLLMKLLKQSVPARYSSWLISNILDYFHNDKHFIQNIIDVLISQLKPGNNQLISALFTIYYAFRYESDFFRLNDSNFGFTQNYTITYNEVEINFNCSFHSFNTTRRLYAVVSERLDLEINSFVIKLNEEMNDTTIPYDTPIQEVIIKPFQTVKLNVFNLTDDVLSNVADPIKNAEFINPNFLQLFQSHIESFWHFLEDDKFSEFVFEMLLLYEQYKGGKENEKINQNLFSYFNLNHSNCPMQSVLLGNCLDPLQFSSMRRVFPTAVKVFTNNVKKTNEINETIQSIIQFLIESKYDEVSLAIICSSILSLNMEFTIPKNILKEGLIECKYQIIRDLIMKIVLITESDRDDFISLIRTALIKTNRVHVRQFFECIKKLQMPPETFVPFYQIIDQLEYSHYKDPDEAFICLLDLIPVNEFTVNLTIDRLFAPPTCRNVAQPFVHTIESWTAALKFLMTPIAVTRLNQLLSTMQIPCTSNASLSCDFTYKGRNGIYNLGMTCYVNALLQVFNVIQPFSLGLISYDTSQLTQFEIELRNILAQLRFVRETVISTENFVDTIPNFENIQQDAIEFMEEAFIHRMNLDLENHDITNVFHGQTLVSFCSYSDDKILSETQEDFYILSLPTEGFSRLDQAFEQFFIDEPIDGGYSIGELNNERVEAYHHKSIIKWPDCLALQLQRWEYSATNGRSKLVDCFGFPIEFDPNELNCSKGTVKCDFIYKLVGVVIHQGTADQGHYYAVVEGEDKEWYLCNDKHIAYFDIKALPDFAFGVSESSLDEDISTAYLLFYCRKDMPPIETNIPNDLEETLNMINATSWPQTIFRNGNFLNYVHDLLENELKSKNKAKTLNKGLIHLAFHAFIKIAMCDEKTFEEWSGFLQKLLFSSKNDNQLNNAIAFFEYIDENVGKSLLQIFNRSDNIIHILTEFIFNAILIANNSLKPFEIIMQNIDLKCGKKQVLSFAFELIDKVCCELKIDWNNEISSIQSIFQYFLTPIPKDVYKLIGNSHSSALNSLLGIYVKLYSNTKDTDSSSTINKAISNIFHMNNLNAIANSVKKKSINFDNLMKMYHNRRPDVFFNLQEATAQTKSILSKFFTRSKFINFENEFIQNSDDIQSNFPTFQYNITSFSNLMFSNESQIRKCYSDKLKSFIEPSQEVRNFLNQKIIIHHFNQSNCEHIYNFISRDSSSCNDDICYSLSNTTINANLENEPSIPQHSEDLSIIPIVLGFLRKFIELIESGKEILTVEYTDILARLSSSYPLSFGVYANIISKALQCSKIERVKLNMVEVLRNIIASDPQIYDKVINNALFDAAERILSTDVVSNSSVELLAALYNQANGTKLLTMCTDYYLGHNIDLHGQILIDLLLPPYSLRPPLFEIKNKNPTNILQIIIATCLLESWKDLVDENNDSIRELKKYINNALKLAVPPDLYLLSKPIIAAVKNITNERNGKY